MVNILHGFMTKETTVVLLLHIFLKQYYTNRPRMELNFHTSTATLELTVDIQNFTTSPYSAY
jgi:hypothetical protein